MEASKRVQEILEKQKSYYLSGNTISYRFRIRALKKLRAALTERESALMEALWKDLHKSPFEVYAHELGQVLKELDLHIKKLKKWMRPDRVASPLAIFPSRSRIYKEPLGNVLIMAPWNYPMLLLLTPLVGAIAAGNTVVLKPSEYSENFNRYLVDLIAAVFQEEQVAVVLGGKDENQLLLKQHWDYIFFTGSSFLGKIVMKAAAEHLTPVTLELGGKSPCIVDEDANLKLAAKRIVWGKFMNAGQTCVAPDYLLVHQSVKEQLISLMKTQMKKYFGATPKKSPDLCRIINANAFERIAGYIESGEIIIGGEIDQAERYIEPTLIDQSDWDAPVMQNEIFGPVLPIISFTDLNQVLEKVNNREKPLAFYYFSNDLKKAKWVLQNTTSGGGCINDTILQIANNKMPFGGVGNSGLGKYHGKLSFDTFSNSRSVVFSSRWIDIPIKYPPYKKKLEWAKHLLT